MHFAVESRAAVLSDKMRPWQVSFNTETSRREVLLILEENLDLMLYLYMSQDKEPYRNNIQKLSGLIQKIYSWIKQIGGFLPRGDRGI